jgi:hypothetical protein
MKPPGSSHQGLSSKVGHHATTITSRSPTFNPEIVLPERLSQLLLKPTSQKSSTLDSNNNLSFSFPQALSSRCPAYPLYFLPNSCLRLILEIGLQIRLRTSDLCSKPCQVRRTTGSQTKHGHKCLQSSTCLSGARILSFSCQIT